MPIYEYICPKCGHDFEVFTVKIEEGTPSCPKCGCEKTKKRISMLGYLKHPDHGGQGKLTSGSTGCSDGSCSK